jgi:hypothetical protein
VLRCRCIYTGNEATDPRPTLPKKPSVGASDACSPLSQFAFKRLDGSVKHTCAGHRYCAADEHRSVVGQSNEDGLLPGSLRSPKRLQTVMGHASVSMTFDRYGHLFESIEADACLGGDRRRAVDGHSARSPSLALRRVSLCHFHLHALLQNRASPRLARKRMPPLTLRLRASRATATAPAAPQYSPRSRPGSPRRRHFNPS